MNASKHVAIVSACALALALAFPALARLAPGRAALAQIPKKDYLTPAEADQIRDAATVSERVKLFLKFAADRLDKIDYELQRKDHNRDWEDRMWGLINAYTGCVDDAADFLESGLEKQENLRPGTKELEKRTQEFLPRVKDLRANAALAKFQSDLDDAIEATQDAADTARKVAKDLSAAPERRKP
ncbi:MAG TPA: hypothetical protein VLW54_00975 [Candidatus Acidoferrales bacterium]|nr:hypothetical protein [Candidatus Acidoferrales bacterium]